MAIHARWIHHILYVHSARSKTCCGIVHYCSGHPVYYSSGHLVHYCSGHLVHYCSGHLVLYVSGQLVRPSSTNRQILEFNARNKKRMDTLPILDSVTEYEKM